MKRTKFLPGLSALTAVAALALAAPGARAAGALESGFQNPPDSARPHTWWHWMNGNISREGITADLEAMKHVGLGGAQIFNVSEGIPDGPAPFMTPQWLGLFHHAVSEADRLGLELCFHNCAGWSSSGGPWMKPEQAMQKVVVSEAHAKGPARFDAALPQPESRQGYYGDVAVLAFPTPADTNRIADVRAKAGFESRYGQAPQPVDLPAGAAIPPERIVDLTAKLAADGRLAWDVPAGEWTILRIGHTLTGAQNAPSPVAGRGLECDKLSAEALDAHWAGGIAPILKELGPLAGKTLNNCLIDSYEVGCCNWTPRLREEFKRRCGYDLQPFLPALAGRVVGGSETTERFLWDFRRVLGDLFAENYYMHFSELCRRNGLLSSIEPYDGPFEGLQVGAKGSILMGEFWAGSGGENSSVKLAAAEAHTHGIRIVGAESFTAAPDQGKWQNHPGNLKTIGDAIWCAGINRFIIHRYAHQPWLDRFPGMTMGQWGTHFERTTTWWEQSPAWLRYCARGQFLLQSGRFAADVLFFRGEASPNGMVHRPDLKARGYDYDAFGTDLVPALTVKDGRIATPGGMSYRLLVLPNTTWMTPALARQVRAWVQAGATVLGPKPKQSPSLAGQPAADAEVAKIADEVWGAGALPAEGAHAFGQGRVVWGGTVEQALAAAQVKPDFETATPGAKTAFIHRVAEGADLYFVSNQQPKTQTLECLFRVAGRQPELWDPETGRIEPAPLWQAKDGRTAVTLTLDPAGSVFVVFRAAAPAAADPVVALASEIAVKPPTRPPAKLEIRKALYGPLSLKHANLADVTDKLIAAVKDNRLQIRAGNELGGDPANNVVKEMRVEYEYNGVTKVKTVGENQLLTLPAPSDGAAGGTLHIVRAYYGKFQEALKGVPQIKTVDVTEKLAALVKDGQLSAMADNALAGGDPAFLVPKQLRVEYALDGVSKSVLVQENSELRLPEESGEAGPAAARLSVENGARRLLAWDNGRYTLTTASGATRTVEVAALPEPVEIAGPWDVEFHSPVGPQPKTTFAQLISWPDHADAGIKYFSGTATYKATFTVPPSALQRPQGAFLLDLGRVMVIAEVKLNGKDLGTLWKAPFRTDATGAVRAGTNELEVRVTNLWPNRLIGDEQYPDDCEWNGITIKAWPEWMVKGGPRPTRERVTFTTWKHWHKDDALLPSGLLGPVVIKCGAWTDAK